jgi:hypothetical protein
LANLFIFQATTRAPWNITMRQLSAIQRMLSFIQIEVHLKINFFYK